MLYKSIRMSQQAGLNMGEPAAAEKLKHCASESSLASVVLYGDEATCLSRQITDQLFIERLDKARVDNSSVYANFFKSFSRTKGRMNPITDRQQENIPAVFK